jgi:hypothetical protein
MSEDPAVVRFRSLQPGYSHDLERFDLRLCGELGEHEVVLELTLRPRAAGDARRLCLTFRGVRGLRIGPDFGLPSLSCLEIVPIVDRGWEGANYRVFEVEGDPELSFYSREIDAAVKSSGELMR